jgi:tetratricopeptide (TPR) repeat protein
MSDIMFIKTERYLHNGVAYQPHITMKDFESPSSATEEYAGIPTVIRRPQEDWRGFIGDLEREIKPWKDPSQHMAHEKGVELLPWFRVMTLVNPHRIRGYKIGAFLMMTRDSPDSLQEAWNFIQEGIKKNPDSHELYYMLIRLAQMDVRLAQAGGKILSEEELRKYDQAALDFAQKGIEVAAPRRPAEGWQGKGRPAEMEDAFAALTHYEVLLLRRLGRDEEALRAAFQSLEKFGSDPVLQNEVAELQAKLRP